MALKEIKVISNDGQKSKYNKVKDGSNQCMLISIADYLHLVLKFKINIVDEFEKFIDRKIWKKNEMFDSDKHFSIVENIAKEYKLEITIRKRIIINNKNYYDNNIRIGLFGYNNENKLDIISYGRHFELIYNGKDSVPFVAKEYKLDNKTNEIKLETININNIQEDIISNINDIDNQIKLNLHDSKKTDEEKIIFSESLKYEKDRLEIKLDAYLNIITLDKNSEDYCSQFLVLRKKFNNPQLFIK